MCCPSNDIFISSWILFCSKVVAQQSCSLRIDGFREMHLHVRPLLPLVVYEKVNFQHPVTVAFHFVAEIKKIYFNLLFYSKIITFRAKNPPHLFSASRDVGSGTECVKGFLVVGINSAIERYFLSHKTHYCIPCAT